ncbi:hypothetical protein LUX57_31380 [Actinomadura madurae]|uniref:hypothetical protein n=1 Tax=Actinomadura madurae TaxID=1993 RepID=UPI0020D21AD1|nr:hypothetical protein [Actinomadura madurae]MCP9969130.1 hypothetical protein [Actinomadura madurae]
MAVLSPAAALGEVVPADALVLLQPEHEVDAAAERVGVDEEGAQALARRGHAERGGEDAGPGAAAGADDAEGGGPAALGLAGGGERVDEPVLVVGQRGDVLGAGLHREAVRVGRGAVAGDEDDARPGAGGRRPPRPRRRRRPRG